MPTSWARRVSRTPQQWKIDDGRRVTGLACGIPWVSAGEAGDN
jgi:hypothetical protein